ncbi:MAG: hypothetical protein Ta2G_08100 [Termitinemataceae bacterium]|nr:MAG: hypothetical protein Ta2G_08100 [Termitinemataceae bacterium]
MAKEKQEKSFAEQEFERRYKQRPFLLVGTVVVLVLVIISFVLVPAIVPSAGGLESDRLTFGYWNGKPISYVGGSYFYKMQSYNSRLAQMGYFYYAYSGGNYSANENSQPSEYEVWDKSFNQAVVRAASLEAMKKAAFEPPKIAVDKKVAALPDFQENGHFSTIKFNETDAATRLSLWQDTKDEMIADRYNEDLASLSVSSKEADFISNMARDTRSFRLAAIPFSSYLETEVISYIEKNPDTFKLLHLLQISAGEKNDVKKLLDAIKKGDKTFEDTARSQSTDSYKARGGDAGVRSAYEFNTLLSDQSDAQKLLTLKKGEYSDVFKTASGWVFFMANEDAVEADKNDAATIAKARSFMLDEQRGTIEDFILDKAQTLVSRSKTGDFTSAAEALDIEVSEFGPLPINYGNSGLFTTLSGFGVQSLGETTAKNENFWKTAFSTSIGTASEPIVLSGSGGDYVVVIYPESTVIAEESDLENIKTTFSSYWQQQDANNSLESAIFNSKKLENNFSRTYLNLFSELN